MLREMMSPQRGVRVIPIRVDGSEVAGGSGTTNGLLEGKFHCLITENSDGNYTIDFNTHFKRTPVVVCMTATDVTTLRIISVDETMVRVEQVGADQTTPTADGDFHLLVVGFDVADQY